MTEEATAQAEVTTAESVDASEDVKNESEAKADDPTEKSDAASEEAETEKPKKAEPDPKLAKKSYEAREAKRRARELQATNERLLRALEARASVQQDKEPQIEDFDSIGDYTKAMYKYLGESAKAEPTDTADQGHSGYEAQIKESLDDLFEVGSDKYEDFEDVVRSPNVKITEIMRDAILDIDDLDMQAEVSYYLGQNPKEVLAWNRLSPLRQAKEIGKLEARLSAKPASKRPSAAPKPVSPVSGGKTDSSVITGDEDFETFVKKRNKQLGRA